MVMKIQELLTCCLKIEHKKKGTNPDEQLTKVSAERNGTHSFYQIENIVIEHRTHL